MADDKLEEQVLLFQLGKLPGQPLGAHMGTVYLVTNLWIEVQRLRKLLQEGQKAFSASLTIEQAHKMHAEWDKAVDTHLEPLKK